MREIKVRVGLILGIFVLFTVINSIGAFGLFKELEGSIDKILMSNHESILATEGMRKALEDEEEVILKTLLDEDEKNIIVTGEFIEFLEQGKKNITEDGEDRVIENIEEGFSRYRNKLLLIENISKEKKIEFYYSEISSEYKDLKEDLKELFNLNQAYIVKMKESSEALAKKAKGYTVVVSLMLLVIGVLFIKYLLNKILNPIEEVFKGLRKVRDGELDYKIPLGKEKEINFLLREFNKMIEKLKFYEKINLDKILRESKKTEAIIEGIDIPIIVTDSRNNIILLNNSMRNLFNIRANIKKKIYFKNLIDNEYLFNIIKKSREDNWNNIYFDELKLKGYYKVIVNQIVFNNKENIGTVVLLQDITKFKEADKLKTDILNTISHEFRTPLTSIRMAIDMLLLNGKEEDLEILNIIKDEEENLDKLVEELLLLSKIEAGKIKMNMESWSLIEICKEVEKKFKLQLREKGLNFTIEKSEKLVLCDKEKIIWVLSNLISNGIRYTKENGNIEITFKEINKRVIIEVKDDGCGIEEKYINQIFNKFFQTGENEGSAGLGLAICKEIIKEHGGKIWAESKGERGATFKFTLEIF